MRILIIKTSSLGDIIHALPVLDFVRQVVPDPVIDWIAEEQFLPLLEHNPYLNRVFCIGTKKWRKNRLSSSTLREISTLKRELQQQRYDVVFDLQGNLKSGVITWLTGAPLRVGFAFEILQEKINALFTNRKISFLEEDTSVTARYLRMVSGFFELGFEGMELPGRIFSSVDDEKSADQYISQFRPGLRIMLQVGTTWKTKLWHREGWIELAQRLNSTWPDATMLVNWGSQEEKELGEAISTAVGDSVVLLPWFTVRELIPVIARCDLLIGGDTGPVYLAAAVGTPTVSYYRATNAAMYAPSGDKHRSLQADMPCAACLKTECQKDEECRRTITADGLFFVAQTLLGKKRTGDAIYAETVTA